MPVYYCTLPVNKRLSTAVYTAIWLITNQRRSRLKDMCILGRTRSGGVYYCVRTLPNTLSSVLYLPPYHTLAARYSFSYTRCSSAQALILLSGLHPIPRWRPHPQASVLLWLPSPGVSLIPEVRCAVVGNVDSGKSTILGVLTRGASISQTRHVFIWN